MKKLLIPLLILVAFHTVAQTNCPKYGKAMTEGTQYFNKNSLDQALIEFQAAQIAARECGLDTNAPAEALVKVFNGLKKQVHDAKQALAQAKKDRNYAENAKRAADKQKQIAERTLGYFFKGDDVEAAWGYDLSSNKFGIINREGEILGDGFVWQNPIPFKDEYTTAWRNDSIWFVNKTGKKISSGYSDIFSTEFKHFLYGDGMLIFYNGQEFEPLAEVSSSIKTENSRPLILPFKNNNKFGFKDRQGIEVFSAEFDEVRIDSYSYGGHAAARKAQAWYLVDIFNSKIIQEFPSVDALNQAYPQMYEDGDVVSDMLNTQLPDIGKNFRIVEHDGLKGIVDSKGNSVLDTAYSEITYFAGDSIFFLTESHLATSGPFDIFSSKTSDIWQRAKYKTVFTYNFFNAKKGLFYCSPTHEADTLWNDNILFNGPTDEKDQSYEYSMLFNKAGKVVPGFNMVSDRVIVNDDETRSICVSSRDNITMLARVGDPVNFRHVIGGLAFSRDDSNSSYYDYFYTTRKKGLVKADGSILTPPVFDLIGEPFEGKRIGKKENKFGFIDSTGWVIPFVYDSVSKFNHGMARVKNEGKYGFIDHKGKELVPVKFDNLGDHFANQLAAAKLGGKWGYIDSTGTWRLEAIYEAAGSFVGGCAKVKKNGMWGFINPKGKTLHPFTLDFARTPTPNGWAKTFSNNKWGFWNHKSNITIPVKYDSVLSFHRKRAWVKLDEKWKLINEKEKVFFERSNLDKIQLLDDGYSIVSEKNYGEGVIDSLGNEIVPMRQNNRIQVLPNGNIIVTDMSEGRSVIFKNGKPVKTINSKNINGRKFINGLMDVDDGIINIDGDYVLEGRYSAFSVAYRTYLLDGGKDLGYAAFTGFGKDVDNDNKPLKLQRFLPMEYEDIGFPLTAEFLPVKKNGLWGFVQWVPQADGTEKPVLAVECRYDAVVPFIKSGGEQIAAVTKNYIVYFINTKGEMLFDTSGDYTGMYLSNEMELMAGD
jgi:hypothetical protein